LQNRVWFVLDSFVTDQPILCICDRCRAEGTAGEGAFAGLGDLLDFEPVPRKARADGWTPGRQRGFIAGVALSGSRRTAAEAVGMSEGSVSHLLKSEGSEGFRSALKAAQRMALEEGRFRGDCNGEATSRTLRPAGGRAAAAAREEPEVSEEAELEMVAALLDQYSKKVWLERRARLEGKVVEADFYLRQMTWFEVVIDLGSHGDGLAAFQRLRCGDHHILQAAETPLSRLLGDLRRQRWAEMGEPERPEHPPRRFLEEHDGFCSEPLESMPGGGELSFQEQVRRFEQQHAADALAQIEWEARAAEQSAAWRARVERESEADERD
jgi:hypothetical protein